MTNKQWSLKHRPANFENMVVGNPDILKEAKQAAAKTVAFFVTGETGTGKTTFARCLANEVNGSQKGVVEDQSTERGIDYIRGLTQRIKFAPPEKKWVVILDEVHNFTKDARTALLKLLEDPPHDRIVFVLCTNHAYMVPKEIKNRCRTFDIQKPDTAEGSRALIRILKKEKMKAEIGDMKKLAKFALTSSGHCMRQALQTLESLYDQFVAGVPIKTLVKGGSVGGEGKQTINEVQKTAGSLLLALKDAFESKDASEAVNFIIPTLTTVEPAAVIGSMQGTLYYGYALANGGNWTWQAKDYKNIFGGKNQPSIDFVVRTLAVLNEIRTELLTATNDPVVIAGTKLSLLAHDLTRE